MEEKNSRIQDILKELGSVEPFFKPRWSDCEQPEEVFNVRIDSTSGSRCIEEIHDFRFWSEMHHGRTMQYGHVGGSDEPPCQYYKISHLPI